MQRSEELEEALDQCWVRLQHGEPTEVCLFSYPDLKSELVPLLAIAQQLQGLAADRPDPTVALAAARERFLRQAAQARARQQRLLFKLRLRGLARQGAGLFTFLLRRSLASTAAVVALVLVLLMGTTAIASANSLPGDPLYPVKRVAESVQLALAIGEESRTSVQRALDQRRIDETRAVLRLGKVTEVSFRGTVEAFDGFSLVAAGFTVRIGPLTKMVGPRPEPGVMVNVTARSRANGLLEGVVVETLQSAPTPTRKPLSPSRGATDRPKPITVAAVSLPTADIRTRQIPQITPSPQVTAAPPACSPTVRPTSTQMATAIGTPSPLPTVTLTSTPPRVVEVRLEGIITRMETGQWEVGGYVVRVTADTQINERVARAEVGARVHIRGIRDSAGAVVARSIIVQQGSTDTGEVVEFQGLIEAISGTQWTVAGQVVEIERSTSITGEARVGWLAEVQARRRPNGALRAIRIVVRAPEEVPVEFVGVIEEIASDHWVVSGCIVHIDSRTAIEGQGAIGRRAEVQGVELSDGTVRALTLRIRETTSPTPPSSPTAEPAEALRTATPSSTPLPTSTLSPTAPPAEEAEPLTAPSDTATPIPVAEQPLIGGTSTPTPTGEHNFLPCPAS